MNKVLSQKLFDEFPILYGKHHNPETENLMCFGFECGDGWYDLLRGLSEKLEELNERHKDTPVTACQVKSKFGGLRFYVDGATDEVYSLIHTAENKSERICEDCGSPGKPRGGGWIRTLCEECVKTRGL